MNVIVNLVKETRETFWENDKAKILADVFEQQVESAVSKFFDGSDLVLMGCRVIGVVVKKIENFSFEIEDVFFKTDAPGMVDTYIERTFIESCTGEYGEYQSLEDSIGTVLDDKVRIEDLQPFIDEIESRGYKVLSDSEAANLLIYAVIPE